MIPVGYMAKRVTARPDWIKADCVTDIYSVSRCISSDFADYIRFWKHNGYWFFDTPQIILQLAENNSIDLTGTKLFFYEVYEREFDEDRGEWVDFQPERTIKTEVVSPTARELEGYDVVTFFARTSAECSPLSCNSLAAEVQTNPHCLLPSLESAQQLLEEGKFKNTEPGPFRIFAVYSTEWPVDVAGSAVFLGPPRCRDDDCGHPESGHSMERAASGSRGDVDSKKKTPIQPPSGLPTMEVESCRLIG